MGINDYLKKSGSIICSGLKTTVVIGNETADLDSIVSSVVYSYYLYHSGVDSVPVINLYRKDFALRNEAVYLFGEASVDYERLLFLEDVNFTRLSERGMLELVLVDHNVPKGILASYERMVKEILDHHAEEKKYPFETAVNIRSVGSTATLVAQRFIHDRPDLIDKEIGTLLLGTILLDTLNLDEHAGRVTPDDVSAAAVLKEITGLECNSLFERLQSEKFNVCFPGSCDLLRKDYKEWQSGKVKIGISSVLISAPEWLKKDPELSDSIQSFCRERDADILLVMNACMNTDFVRYLGVYIPDSSLRLKTTRFLEQSDLGLVILDSRINGKSGELVYYYQENNRISRKKLQPLLNDFFS